MTNELSVNQFIVLLAFLAFKLSDTHSAEIDRTHAAGNHGYSSLVDVLSQFTLVPKLRTATNVGTKYGSESQGIRNKLSRISGVKFSVEVPPEKSSNHQIQKPKSAVILNTANIFTEKENKTFDSLVNALHFYRKDKHQKNIRKTSENFGDMTRMLDHSRRVSPEGSFIYEVPLIDTPTVKNAKVSKVSKNPQHIQKVTNSSKTKSIDSVVLRVGKKIADLVSNKGLEPKLEVVVPEADVSLGRFLSIFEVVNFNNVDCLSSSGLQGTCLHPMECSDASGVSLGVCAEGFGVCCVFQYSCGDQTSANCSSFTNPGFPRPSSERLACTLTVAKASDDVTQLRLDFVQLELQPPTNGSCVEDQFVITGQNLNSIIPILCGNNNGQHVYVEVGQVPGPFYVSVQSGTALPRLFHVRVCQLTLGAPAGCLQHHTGARGALESFNYASQPPSLAGNRAPGYTNNLNYAICIERVFGSCSVTYTNAEDGTEFEFQISNYDADGVPLLPPGQAGAEIFNCPDDYIVFNGIRLCGERLNDASVIEDFTQNAPVTELGAGPIVLVFRTNGNVTGRGFRLYYNQNPCVTSN